MVAQKKKMDEKTKVKLIYSVELLVFAIVFFVIGLLEMLKVITISDTYHTIFNWVTIFGGVWLIADTIWALVSKKRQKRVSLLDKFIMLPLGIYLIAFDLFCLITSPEAYEVYQYGMSSPFLYIALSYAFQGIFHYFYPVPGLLDDLEAKVKELANQDENKVVEEPSIPEEEQK